MIKLGCQLFTLRDYIQNYDDCEKTFSYLNSIGINVIQISAIGPIPVKDVAYLIKKYNMDCCVTHISFDRMINELDTVMSEHSMYNCDTIGIGSMPERYRKSEQGIIEFIKDSSAVAHKLSENGFKFAYHNHSFEFYKFPGGKSIYEMLINETNPEEFTFIPDTYWYQYAGVNPADILKKIKRRVKVVHFKDYKVDSDGAPKFAEIGNGNINWAPIYKACKDIGAGYIVIEQDTCEIDPRESMALSYKELLKIAANNK